MLKAGQKLKAKVKVRAENMGPGRWLYVVKTKKQESTDLC